MRLAAFIATLLFAAPAFAERVWLSPEEFEAKVSGRAVQIYERDGELFGTEYFMPGRKVIWKIAGSDDCVFGTWQPREESVCYSYQGGYGSCLRYYTEADKLVGVDWVAGKATSNSFNLTIVNETLPACSSN